MKAFMDENFLLTTEAARRLYHDCAESLPIIDYHCHINPREIYEDRRYDNIAQVWLGGDHYKWRLMRSAGVDERYITGDAPDRDKFQKWAETLGMAIGNPLYHWSHLELRRFFGYRGALSGATAGEVWDLCNKKLAEPGFSVRGLIKMSNVRIICTTDDPADTLEWHKKLSEDDGFETTVLPAFRPDKAMNIEKPDFPGYLERLGEAAGVRVSSFETLKMALQKRMAFFHENGCRLSDHALEYVMFAPEKASAIESIFAKRMRGDMLTARECLEYKTAFMLFVAQEYHQMGWVMQLHYGCKRDNNRAMFDRVGPDTGFDCINNYAPSASMADFLGMLSAERMLPKTIIYSLNPGDDPVIDSIIGCFQGDGVTGKIQHGSAWWFNDHIDGMTRQMVSLANLGYLAGFVGMLTDSRSFLSYPRHEYFRRLLCRIMGEWVDDGQFPEDYDTLGKIVSGICVNNAADYFDFPEKR